MPDKALAKGVFTAIKNPPVFRLMENGASEGTRTLMRKAQDPKSCASTNSATLAYFLIIVCNGNRVKKRPVKNLPCKNREGSL